MEKRKAVEYKNRIINGTKVDLVVITYELIIDELNQAANYYTEEKQEKFNRSLDHVSKYVNELIVSLDFKYQISQELLQIYLFINKLIVKTKVKKDIQYIDDIKEIIRPLIEAFKRVLVTEKGQSNNLSQLYAGLTYGKNTLNETVIHSNNKEYQFLG